MTSHSELVEEGVIQIVIIKTNCDKKKLPTWFCNCVYEGKLEDVPLYE